MKSKAFAILRIAGITSSISRALFALAVSLVGSLAGSWVSGAGVSTALAAADAPHEIVSSRIHAVQSKTSDSKITFEGHMPEGTRWVLIDVKKAGASTSQRSVLPWQDAPSFDVYLSEGPGAYTIGIYLSTDPSKTGSQYFSLDFFDIQNDDARDLRFLLPSSEIQAGSPEIIALATKLTQGLTTDLEKTQAIHDWVAGHIAYDADGFFSGNYVSKESDALNTLKTGIGVCEGYTHLTIALHRAAGIRARYVRGAAASIFTADMTIAPGSAPSDLQCNHAWSEVLVDGRWIVQDTTWDAGYVDPATHKFHFSPSRRYFDPSPEEFSRSHQKCGEILK